MPPLHKARRRAGAGPASFATQVFCRAGALLHRAGRQKRESRGAAHMPPAALRRWGAAPAALCQARRRKRTRAGPDGQPSVQRRKKGRTRARRPPQRQTNTPLCAKQNKAPAQNNKGYCASFHTFLKLYSEHIIPYMVLFCKGALARRDGLEYHKIPARKRRAGERRQSGPRRAGAGGTKNAGGYRHGGCGYEKLGTGI